MLVLSCQQVVSNLRISLNANAEISLTKVGAQKKKGLQQPSAAAPGTQVAVPPDGDEGRFERVQAGRHANRQAGRQTRRQANKQAGGQASRQASIVAKYSLRWQHLLPTPQTCLSSHTTRPPPLPCLLYVCR